MAFQSFSNMILEAIGLDRPKPAERRAHSCCIAPSSPYDFDVRTSIGDSGFSIYGWPSRGGVIILDDADPVDIEFLGLHALDPAELRDKDQAAEDLFCQRLLLLGSKWYDSAERRYHVGRVKFATRYGGEIRGHGDGSFIQHERPEPTLKETCWVKVGWPSTGGIWVAEFEQTWGTFEDEDKLPPDDVDLARYKLARTMDERCQILKDRMHARFYAKLEDYEGLADLRAWERKTSGEVGQLLSPAETTYEWSMSKGLRKIETDPGEV